MKETGIIISITGQKATVQINRGQKCEGCNLCQAFGNNKMLVKAYNKTEAGIGDVVEVSIEPKYVLASSLLIFIFPIFMMLLGYFVGIRFSHSASESGGIIGSIIGFLLSFVLIKFLEKFIKPNTRETAFITNLVQKF